VNKVERYRERVVGFNEGRENDRFAVRGMGKWTETKMTAEQGCHLLKQKQCLGFIVTHIPERVKSFENKGTFTSARM
jgi:hypothetical protein